MKIYKNKSPKTLKNVGSFKKDKLLLPGCGYFLGEI